MTENNRKTTQNSDNKEDYFLSVKNGMNGDYDKSRIVVKKCKMIMYKTGTKQYVCDAFYKNKQGVECNWFLQKPSQVCRIEASYVFGTPKDDKSPEKMNGINLVYPNTSMETMNNLTPEEEYYKGVMEDLYRIIEKECMRAVKEGDKDFPGIAKGAFKHYQPTDDPNPDDKDNTIKSLYPSPYTDKDKTYPGSTFVKMYTKGQGSKLTCDTKAFVNKEQRNPIGLVGKFGKAQPISRIEGIRLGSHGTAAYVASLIDKVVEFTFSEITNSKLPQKSFIEDAEEDDNESPMTQLESVGSSKSKSKSFAKTNSDSDDVASDDEGGPTPDTDIAPPTAPPKKRTVTPPKKIVKKLIKK